jgi:hypothetical protein
MTKDWPRCGLVNPQGAQRCDCGYDFTTQQMERSYLQPKQMARAAAAAAAAAVAAAGIGGIWLAFVVMRIIWQLVNGLGK